jgi:ABC-type antimicrobial peptide transport system permease subunit
MKLLQALVFSLPVFWFSVRLSMVMAAQYWVAVQPKPSNCGT